jgi:hypothetical protein
MPTKKSAAAQMEDAIQNAFDALDGAYTPAATRAELVEAVSDALDTLRPFADEEDDEDEGDGADEDE